MNKLTSKQETTLAVSGYHPQKGEVDSLPQLNFVKKYSSTIDCLLPCVVNAKESKMVFRKFEDKADLKVPFTSSSFFTHSFQIGKYGIQEPNNSCPISQPNIVITPLVSFDRSLNRIGWGKGFYDRAIAKAKSNMYPFLTIGVAYECQKYHELLPSAIYDERLDIIITEERSYFNDESSLIKKIFDNRVAFYYFSH